MKGAKHGYLDCLRMVNVGWWLLVWRWDRSVILRVVSTVELVEHVALLGRGEGILRVLLALLLVVVWLLLNLRWGLEVQEESGCGEHRLGATSGARRSLYLLQTTDALRRRRRRRRKEKKTAQQKSGQRSHFTESHLTTVYKNYFACPLDKPVSFGIRLCLLVPSCGTTNTPSSCLVSTFSRLSQTQSRP